MRIKPSNRELRSIRLAKAKKIATHTKREWDLLKEFCNNTCVICGGSSGLINVEKDHITPIYQGGSDGIKISNQLAPDAMLQKAQITLIVGQKDGRRT